MAVTPSVGQKAPKNTGGFVPEYSRACWGLVPLCWELCKGGKALAPACGKGRGCALMAFVLGFPPIHTGYYTCCLQCRNPCQADPAGIGMITISYCLPVMTPG